MAIGGIPCESERDVEQGMDSKKEEARLAATDRMNAKIQSPGRRRLQKRGEVTRGIVKDALIGTVRTLKRFMFSCGCRSCFIQAEGEWNWTAMEPKEWHQTDTKLTE